MFDKYIKPYALAIAVGVATGIFKWEVTTQVCGTIPLVVLIALGLVLLGGYSWSLGYGPNSESDRNMQMIGQKILEFAAVIVGTNIIVMLINLLLKKY